MEGCQKESRQYASELYKIKTAHEETLEQLEAVRRESKAHQGMRLVQSHEILCLNKLNSKNVTFQDTGTWCVSELFGDFSFQRVL